MNSLSKTEKKVPNTPEMEGLVQDMISRVGKVKENWSLIPREDADKIIQAYSQDEPNAKRSDALELVGMLMGSYPAHNVADPEVYTRAIASVFMKYPKRIGFMAIDFITMDKKFLPSRAELKEACERFSKHEYRAYSLAVAMNQERDRRIKVKALEEELAKGRAEARCKYEGMTTEEIIKQSGLKKRNNE